MTAHKAGHSEAQAEEREAIKICAPEGTINK